MYKFSRILLITSVVVLSSINNSAFANSIGNSIIISEIEYDPAGAEPGSEWIELYNPTEKDIDISAWQITDGEGTLTIPSATIISSGKYYIFAHTTSTFNSNYPAVTVDLEYSPIDVGSISLANTGDEVTLSDDDTTIIDFVSWEDHTIGWLNSAVDGSSIARSTSIDTDASSDWLDNQIPSPGTGTLSVIIIPRIDPPKKMKSSIHKSKIRYTCNDISAENYNRFGRHKQSLCRYTLQTDLENRCELTLTRKINYGERGVEITTIQKCMNRLGYFVGRENGIYGPLTMREIIYYKKAMQFVENNYL